MVPVPVPLTMLALVAPLSSTVKLSVPSGISSSVTSSVIWFEVSCRKAQASGERIQAVAVIRRKVALPGITL